MAHHSSFYVEKLENQLQERFEKLRSAMRGTEVSKDEMRRFDYTTPHRSITTGDVRVSVDDFATILKEIKSSLGKR